MRFHNCRSGIDFRIGNEKFFKRNNDDLQTEGIEIKKRLKWKYSFERINDTVFIHDCIMNENYPCFSTDPRSIMKQGHWIQIYFEGTEIISICNTTLMNFSEVELFESSIKYDYYKRNKEIFDNYYIVNFEECITSNGERKHVILFDKATLKLKHWHCVVKLDGGTDYIDYLVD